MSSRHLKLYSTAAHISVSQPVGILKWDISQRSLVSMFSLAAEVSAQVMDHRQHKYVHKR